MARLRYLGVPKDMEDHVVDIWGFRSDGAIIAPPRQVMQFQSLLGMCLISNG